MGLRLRLDAQTDRRFALALALGVALAAVLSGMLAGSVATTRAEAAGSGCAHATSKPGEATARQLRRALGCLINVERAKRDRRLLRRNGDLAELARRHTRVMLAEDCFRHTCPGERPLRRRIESSGYVPAGGRYGYGENLGCSRTPAGMVNAWMGHSFHRRNILDRRFRHMGIGAKRGSPYPPGVGDCSPGRRFMTYTVIFGWRKRAS